MLANWPRILVKDRSTVYFGLWLANSRSGRESSANIQSGDPRLFGRYHIHAHFGGKTFHALRITFCSSGEFLAFATYSDKRIHWEYCFLRICIEFYMNFVYKYSKIYFYSEKKVTNTVATVIEVIVTFFFSRVILQKLLNIIIWKRRVI